MANPLTVEEFLSLVTEKSRDSALERCFRRDRVLTFTVYAYPDGRMTGDMAGAERDWRRGVELPAIALQAAFATSNEVETLLQRMPSEFRFGMDRVVPPSQNGRGKMRKFSVDLVYDEESEGWEAYWGEDHKSIFGYSSVATALLAVLSHLP